MSVFAHILSLFVVAVILNTKRTETQKIGQIHHAIVILTGKNGIRGELRFRENIDNGKVNIRGTVEGLPKGPHGMHVHQYGDLSKGCEGAGGHFDVHRGNAVHGARDDAAGHTGDFGNIVAGDSGVAKIYINDSFVQLHGDASIVGRAVLIHKYGDDLGKGGDSKSLETGNAGEAIACGIVAWDD